MEGQCRQGEKNFPGDFDVRNCGKCDGGPSPIGPLLKKVLPDPTFVPLTKSSPDKKSVAPKGCRLAIASCNQSIPPPASHQRRVSMPDPFEVCETAARAGGRVLLDWVGRFAVSTKGPRDFVTEADLAAQNEIRRIVLDAFPEHGFQGEESIPGQATADPRGYRWIVDPLDGTTNYIKGIPAYCTSVALARGGEILVGAIYDPLRDECFTARAGGGAWLNGRPITTASTVHLPEAVVAVSFPPQVTAESAAVEDFLAVLPHALAIRRSGSSAINLAYVACGRFDGFWVRRIQPWDVAAGLLLVSEAGGSIGSFVGGPGLDLNVPAFISAATPSLLEALQRVLPPHAT